MRRYVKIIICAVVISFCAGVYSPHAAARDEKRAFDRIEELFLKEDFKAAKRNCNRFLRNYKKSGLKKRVIYLRDISTKKISSESDQKSVDQDIEGVNDRIRQEDIYYIVQAGAFKKYRNAKKLKRSLKKKGFDVVILKVRRGTSIFYRVRAGKFKELKNAKQLVKDLKKKGYTSEIVNEE